MTRLIPVEGVFIGFLLAFPAIRAGFSGTLALDTVLLRLILGVLGASIAVNVIRAIVRSYASKPNAMQDRRRPEASSANQERPGG